MLFSAPIRQCRLRPSSAVQLGGCPLPTPGAGQEPWGPLTPGGPTAAKATASGTDTALISRSLISRSHHVLGSLSTLSLTSCTCIHRMGHVVGQYLS